VIANLLELLTDPTPSPTPLVNCQGDDACLQFYDWFKSAKVAEASLWVIKPARILLIILLAMVLRYVLNRTVTRMTTRAADGKIPTILRPLREKLPTALTEPTTMFPERRRQRAEAIGSVLRSFVTVTVFSIAGLMVLEELGINLTPLVAGLGIVGAALGFGAQTLVKDLISGLFMLLEDQYGVGDLVDVGDVVGVVEAVGLRTITIRDGQGVVWYVRNGEIIRVGNRSQGNSVALVDIPIGFAGVDEAVGVLRTAAQRFAEDPEYADDFLEPPEVAGVEAVTVDGVTIRVMAKTTNEAHLRVVRELRRRMTEALESSGIAAAITASRVVRPSPPGDGENGVRGPAPV
jgi:moderate conductance mechanosensitive channel